MCGGGRSTCFVDKRKLLPWLFIRLGFGFNIDMALYGFCSWIVIRFHLRPRDFWAGAVFWYRMTEKTTDVSLVWDLSWSGCMQTVSSDLRLGGLIGLAPPALLRAEDLWLVYAM